MKKIEIISEDRDKTTDEVIEWLLHDNINFNRSNVENLTCCTILLSNKISEIKIEGEESLKKIIWNRRGKYQLLSKSLNKSPYSNYLKKEVFPILQFIEKQFKENKELLGSYVEESLNNKIINLSIAKEVGLNIPETIVTNEKSKLIDFYYENLPIVAKCFISNPTILSKKYQYSTSETFLVREEEIEFLSDTFAPSLFQKYIEKKYELRVFVSGDYFFAMAIFSQNDEQTKIDFRNYNRSKPNRNVPFELPEEIKAKIKLFLKQKQMNQGSIDLIVTPENEFFFLEINPQGQLDWLSKNCNYYIEKHIANQLANQKINLK